MAFGASIIRLSSDSTTLAPVFLSSKATSFKRFDSLYLVCSIPVILTDSEEINDKTETTGNKSGQEDKLKVQPLSDPSEEIVNDELLGSEESILTNAPIWESIFSIFLSAWGISFPFIITVTSPFESNAAAKRNAAAEKSLGILILLQEYLLG